MPIFNFNIFKKPLTPRQEFFRAEDLIAKLLSLKIVKFILWVIFFIIVTPFIVFFTFQPHTQKDIIYGVNFSKKYSRWLAQDWKSTYLKLLDDLGAKHVRLVSYWDETEVNPGEFDYSDIKWQLDEAQKRDVKVIMTIGRKVPRFPECFEPDWWKKLPSQETKDKALFTYLEKTMYELRDYQNITRWQVENEPFFPFGECEATTYDTLLTEIRIVRNLDTQKRPILVQDSGEGGFWFPSYHAGDYLGISMYRKIYYNFWGVLLGQSIYFQYPLAHWTYYVKARILGIDPYKIIVTELQSEPWGPGFVSDMTNEEKDNTMSRELFIDTLNYAQKAGFKEYYFWGPEWWLWEKEANSRAYFWETAKALFK